MDSTLVPVAMCQRNDGSIINPLNGAIHFFQDLSQGYLTVYKRVSHLSLPYSISSKVQKCLPFWAKKIFLATLLKFDLQAIKFYIFAETLADRICDEFCPDILGS